MKLIIENKKPIGQRILEAKADVEVKHEGILEVPEGKKVNELPLSHFEKLVDKKGYAKVIRALNNLQVWNKNDDKALSDWASSTMAKLKAKYRKDESLDRSIYKRYVDIAYDKGYKYGYDKKERANFEKWLIFKIRNTAGGTEEDIENIMGAWDNGNFKAKEDGFMDESLKEGLWDVTPLSDDPKVGDKFRSPRGSHEVRAIFKDRKEAEENEGYGYWFTTDDDWDIFAYNGNGYSVGIAPAYIRRMKMRRPIEEARNIGGARNIGKYKTKEGRLVTIREVNPNTLFSIGSRPWIKYNDITIEWRDVPGMDVNHASLGDWFRVIKDGTIDKIISEKETSETLTEGTSINAKDWDEFLQIAKTIGMKDISDIDRLHKMYPDLPMLDAIKKYRDEELLSFDESLKEHLEEPKEEIKPTPVTPEDNGLTTILNELVKSEYDAIDQYNSAIVTAKELGREDIVEILTAIAHDENTHVGNLLVATKLVNPQTQAIEKGEEEAIGTLEGDVEIE